MSSWWSTDYLATATYYYYWWWWSDPEVHNLLHRDALSDLALHFLNKMKIMVVKDVEREEIEFICKVSHASSTQGSGVNQGPRV